MWHDFKYLFIGVKVKLKNIHNDHPILIYGVLDVEVHTRFFLLKMISQKLLVLFPVLIVLNHKSSAQQYAAPPGVNPQLYTQQQQQVNKNKS